MPPFQAINVEPEDNLVEEIDDTKEIHVEDALKRFQTALKFHAQGPRFFDEAADAYDALFQAEIFKYPESKTEYERNERNPDGSLLIEPTFTPGLDLTGADPDGVDNTYPQALYLSYKNHGQFIIDRIKQKAQARSLDDKALLEDPEIREDAQRALDEFDAALDRDPSDPEVWGKTARVAAFLKSARISRYSLEAAIELDDDPAVVDVEPPSLAEALAGEQLREQLEVLDDKMALTHPIMKPFCEKSLPTFLRQYLDPIPFLPNPTKSLATLATCRKDGGALRIDIDVPSSSWAELGVALVQFASDHGFSGDGVSITLPNVDDNVQMEVDRQLQLAEEVSSPNKKKDSPAEKSKQSESGAPESAPAAEDAGKDRSVALPSRKRSQSAAGLVEPPDDEAADNKRSKRTRRRDTEVMDPATLLATQLQPFQAADQNLFQMTKDLLENLGVTDKITLEGISEILESCSSDNRTAKIRNTATLDLREAILNFDPDTADILLSEREIPQLSLSAFLEHSKSSSQRTQEPPAFDEVRDLRSFAESLNTGWNTIHDMVFEYVKALAKGYAKFKWSEQLKYAVLQVIGRLSECIYQRVLEDFEVAQVSGQVEGAATEIPHLVQMLFELHLDVYESITNPNSVVDATTRIETKARLDKWMDLATQVHAWRSGEDDDSLSLRFLWGAVIFNTLSKDISRDHILACWHSLRDHISSSLAPEITLPNNAVMPEISTAAAEREISKLTTMDFFLSIFQGNMGDAPSIIRTLEPVLNPDSVYVTFPPSPEAVEDGGDLSKQKEVKKPIKECASQGLLDLWKFLQTSSTELRLLLWAKLGDAYGQIDYPTKQFSCFLRSIETVVYDFEREDYVGLPKESRKVLFMTMLKALDDLIIQSLYLAINNNSSFDIIDEDHLHSTLSALAKVSCLLHVAAMFEDEVSIGMVQAPTSSKVFSSFLTKLREMQVRTWCLQYTVIKVGISLHPSIFPKRENDLADYLAAVHQVLGLRKCCKVSNQIFLKMMRIELLKQKDMENWEDYLGQVLYDLHGLKLGVGVWDLQDHGCTTSTLDRKQAMALVEKITVLANRMTMRDLIKSELKNTIEQMQQAIGSPKSTPHMTRNLRNFNEYIKTPIHPLHLYQSLSGSIDLDAITINTPESAPAKQGWFFLLGLIALTKFKAVDLNRRQTPGATDDLRIATTFFRLQLQFTPDHWEAWFRLAQCFDCELDEMVLWSADKMNKDRADLVKLQRHSVHCYTLALSYAYGLDSSPMELADPEDEQDAVYDLYYEFGMRMYASSREPFAMEPFKHSDQERFFIQTAGPGTFKKILHPEMTDYQVWRFAANMFRKAMRGKPKDWRNHYMLAKCLWKMHQKPLSESEVERGLTRPTVQMVLQALEKAVEVTRYLPKPRSGQDPILEPHYKIVSIVHKLVVRGDLPVQEGADLLQRQPYAPNRGEKVTVGDLDNWEAYVIRCLRHLGSKDKSNWQHRIIMRHAHILFPEDSTESEEDALVPAKAVRAFAVLRESMFTKTMVMNVWKCLEERSGRHHVYTEQYTRYVVRLLVILKDRTNLELVLRRIRKKSADFYHFQELWQHCVVAYVKMVRQAYKVPLTEEDPFKNLSPDEFDVIGERMADWVTKAEAENHPAVAALKEASEIKKLNANLMKAGPIDDLIADAYSTLYLDIKSEFPAPPEPEPVQATEGQSKTDEATTADMKAKLFNGLLKSVEDTDVPTTLGSLRATSEQPGSEKMEKQLSSTGEAAPRGRRPGVRRPDILRKAELAVARAAEPPKSAGAAGGPKSRVGSMSSAKNNRTSHHGDGSDADDDEAGHDGDVEMQDADEAHRGSSRRGSQLNDDSAMQVDDENGSDVSSPPKSLHESADESDLSDVPDDYEDDIPPSLLFPNLRRSVDTGTAGTGVDTSTSDMEEEEEDDEEEDEEEEGGEEEAGEAGEADEAMEEHEEGHEDGHDVEMEDEEDEEDEDVEETVEGEETMEVDEEEAEEEGEEEAEEDEAAEEEAEEDVEEEEGEEGEETLLETEGEHAEEDEEDEGEEIGESEESAGEDEAEEDEEDEEAEEAEEEEEAEEAEEDEEGAEDETGAESEGGSGEE
ncbi:histone transcription regulator 3 [Rhypophila decipiens]|uniref:Histone transcription regulator 3 homolog n=1 Tax=Rhypophila decipiens TaxID=261697 RepID=A0AAN6Y987_9PEZI|nr:histone transcription regulator 3 [Rhypophila decipiens]